MNNEVLAIVAGKEITNADVDAFLANLPAEQRQYASNPYFREQYVEQVVTLHVLEKMADDLQLDMTEDYKKMLDNIVRDIKARMAMNEIMKDITVTDIEAETVYNINPDNFSKPETVSAKHILVDSEDVCNEILAQIQNGEKTFEDAAKESSTCPSGQQGGDLGEFGRGQMVKEFEEAAFAAEIGAIVGPVQTQFGFHLIKVEAKSEAETLAFDVVKEQIKKNLLQQKQQQAYTTKIAELKEKYVEKQ
ncbi:MAG: peptidylprolyl isomerase [Lachnospiraceae bacterium]|jgi:peptidyl-prolyl cis-trans isomerase C|nr:peptidylprolyl isomerase [Lachnospiraceae bacterium]MBQ5659858.1 peptidylprolyl isomerase [Lachnospiraceae bacterium]MBR0305453.1 peptidylprolyl isomerase [Lachnospiraceae bacterium]